MSTIEPGAVQPHDDAAAYAIGVLDADEHAAFEAHLPGCAPCREEVRRLRETSAVLAGAQARPAPASLRDAVLAAVAEHPRARATDVPAQQPPASGEPDAQPPASGEPDAQPAPVVPLQRRPGPRVPRTWLLAAAAALVVAVAGVGARAWQADRDADRMRDQLAAVARLAADPGAERATATIGGGSATMIHSGSDAVIMARGLPSVPTGRAYQLWVIESDRARSAGMSPAGSSASGEWWVLLRGLREGQRLAVTVEPRTGSPRPTTPPVASMEV